MPGIFGGATSFDPLARQLVASRKGLEVWAVDRRANALEDHSALVKSLRTHNPDTAYRYYGEDAGTPAGFNAVSADDAGFMRRWGLVTHLRDLHAVVEKANAEAETVVLGGHSLGASIVSFYAAYRFADGLGDAQLDGLLLLDGTLGRTGAFGLTAGLTLGNLELIPDAAGYDAGRGPPFLALGVGPGFYAQQESRALLARFRPKQLAPDTSFLHHQSGLCRRPRRRSLRTLGDVWYLARGGGRGALRRERRCVFTRRPWEQLEPYRRRSRARI